MKSDLDKTDLIILSELQQNGRVTNVELSRRADISAPSCLRRMRFLEEEGYIRGYEAKLNDKKLGLDIQFFIMVKLKTQEKTPFTDFITQIEKTDAIRSAWMLSGDIDCMLHGIAPNMAAFEDLINHMISWDQVASIKSMLSFRELKSAPLIPNDQLLP